MGWRPKDFWRATIPEVFCAIEGDNARQLEELKAAWEPARFVAYVSWQAQAGKGGKLKNLQQLMRFPWEKKIPQNAEVKAVMKSIKEFRKVVTEKWGLKYPDNYE